MSGHFFEYTRRRVFFLIGLQACFICLLVFGTALFKQKQIVLSVFVGSMIFFISNWCFLLFSLRKYSILSPELAVKNIYIGQAMKLALVVGLGVVFIHLFAVNALAVLFSFIVSVLAHCFTLLLIFQSR